jgi:hypothetical protein
MRLIFISKKKKNYFNHNFYNTGNYPSLPIRVSKYMRLSVIEQTKKKITNK